MWDSWDLGDFLWKWVVVKDLDCTPSLTSCRSCNLFCAHTWATLIAYQFCSDRTLLNTSRTGQKQIIFLYKLPRLMHLGKTLWNKWTQYTLIPCSPVSGLQNLEKYIYVIYKAPSQYFFTAFSNNKDTCVDSLAAVNLTIIFWYSTHIVSSMTTELSELCVYLVCPSPIFLRSYSFLSSEEWNRWEQASDLRGWCLDDSLWTIHRLL